MGSHRLTALVVLILFGSSLSLGAEAVVATPYSPDEFPRWALDLRRAEIVAIGVFPIALLASSLLYGVIRFGYQSARAGELDRDYAPWFFAPPGAPGLTDGERVGILAGAGAISITVALADHILGRRERRGQR